MVSYPFTVRDCCLVVDGGRRNLLRLRRRSEIAQEETRLRARCRRSAESCELSSMSD